jgi:2-C-methyl-D-erythritol 4-phosphate cytidylyltransferase
VSSRTAAVVVAAGSGERLGAGPKAFVDLCGEPLLVHAVRAFAGLTDDVVVVVAPGDVDRAEALLDRAGLPVTAVCAGGATRQESVARGLDDCPPRTGTVAVHDAARPLVSRPLIRRTLGGLVEPWAAVAPGLPVVDTLKLVDEERVIMTVDRRDLWAVQTPQAFDRAVLQRVHDRLDARDATDDLALVEAAGGRVRVVAGERRNFKITYPEDIAMAEALLAGKRP